jgi:hypothetical protein
MGTWTLLRKFRLLKAVLSVTATAVILTGCQTVEPRILDPIRIVDEEAPAYTGSMIIRPPTMAGRRTQGGVEFNYERYRGQSEQRLDPNHYVETNEITLLGPQIIDNTADSESGRVAYNHLVKLGPHFELEPSLGVTYERLLLTTTGRLPYSGQRDTVDDKSFGMGLNFIPRFNVNQFVAIEGKVGFTIDEDSDTSLTRHMAIVLSPIPNIALRGGYYWRDQDVESHDGNSDFEIDFEGALASVTLRF